jgi:hypothetical protein
MCIRPDNFHGVPVDLSPGVSGYFIDDNDFRRLFEIG